MQFNVTFTGVFPYFASVEFVFISGFLATMENERTLFRGFVRSALIGYRIEVKGADVIDLICSIRLCKDFYWGVRDEIFEPIHATYPKTTEALCIEE